MKFEIFRAKLMPKLAIFEVLTVPMLAQNFKKTGNDANKLRTLSDASNKSVFPFKNLDSHLQDFFSKFCSKIGKNDDFLEIFGIARM